MAPHRTAHLWLTGFDLLVGLFLVVASERTHIRPCDEFADVRHQPLAIVVTAVGPQGEGGVSETAQIAHRLAVSRPSESGIAQDRFFQFGVGDLTLGHGGRAGRAEEDRGEKDPSEIHIVPGELTRSVLAAKLSGFATWNNGPRAMVFLQNRRSLEE